MTSSKGNEGGGLDADAHQISLPTTSCHRHVLPRRSARNRGADGSGLVRVGLEAGCQADLRVMRALLAKWSAMSVVSVLSPETLMVVYWLWRWRCPHVHLRSGMVR